MQIILLEKTFEQQNRLAHTGLTQGHGISQIQQRKAIGQRFQRPGNTQQAVSIGVGLDHGPDLCRSRLTPGHLVIVAQGGMVDTHLNRTRHVYSFLNRSCAPCIA